jgi:hypothetical protein
MFVLGNMNSEGSRKLFALCPVNQACAEVKYKKAGGRQGAGRAMKTVIGRQMPQPRMFPDIGMAFEAAMPKSGYEISILSDVPTSGERT